MRSRGSLKVNDKAWRELRRNVEALATARVKVGVLASQGGNATVPGASITMVELAAIHEFGSPSANIPERSFIRLTLAGAEDQIAAILAKISKAVVVKGMAPEKALGILGLWLSTEIKKTITTGPSIPPALKSETIARKGSSRALVDTGRLVDSVSFEVAL